MKIAILGGGISGVTLARLLAADDHEVAPGDDGAGHRAAPMILQRSCHRRGGLAGTGDDQLAVGRRRQVFRDAIFRPSGRHGGVEQAPQQILAIDTAIGRTFSDVVLRVFLLCYP